MPTHPLYCWYEGQTQPQDAYIEIDLDEETVRADWDAEIGNAVPANVWHGRARRFNVSNQLTQEEVDALIEKIKPYAKVLYANYIRHWDGSNYVSRFEDWDEDGDCDSYRAFGEITRLCYEAQIRGK